VSENSNEQHDARLMGLKQGAAWVGMDFYWFRELVESGEIASLQRAGRYYTWPAAIAAFLGRRVEQAQQPRRVRSRKAAS
jgi:hypothetical protein